MSFEFALERADSVCFTNDHGYEASASHGVLVYAPSFRRYTFYLPAEGWKAKLTWEVGYVPRWFTRPQPVTHPSSNRARRRLHSLMRPTTLPSQNVERAAKTRPRFRSSVSIFRPFGPWSSCSSKYVFNKNQTNLAKGGIAVASLRNSSFVFARWQHKIDGLAIWLGVHLEISPSPWGSGTLL